MEETREVHPAFPRNSLDPERTSSDDFRSGAGAAAARGTGEDDGPPAEFPGLRVLGREGEGAFGAVYRAFDEKLEREVALKVLRAGPGLDPALRRTFLGEARALARIRHPNVLQIHNVIEEDGRIGLVMEFIDGEDLEDLVRRNGPLGAGEAVQVGIHLLRALAAVHGAGLLHRDVKASNVLREKGGRIVLADFGLGIFLGEAKQGDIAGSPLFMSPEQAEGRALDGRSDLYSLGVLLYYLVAGKFPFREMDFGRLFEEKRSGSAIPLTDARPDLPVRFVEAVHRALRPDPRERFRSAGEMEEELLACLGRDDPRTGEKTVPIAEPPKKRWRPSTGARAILGAALLVAAILVTGLVMPLFLDRARSSFVEDVSLWRSSRWGEPVRLGEGQRVAVGDSLGLRFKADRDAWVYVLDEDEKGQRSLLFPAADLDQQNPLPGEMEHRLPGSGGGRSKAWPVNSQGGRESIFVVASLTPLGEVEALARSRPRPDLSPTALREILRGIDGPADVGPVLDGKEFLASFIDELERLSKGGGARRGLWVKKFTLENR